MDLADGKDLIFCQPVRTTIQAVLQSKRLKKFDPSSHPLFLKGEEIYLLGEIVYELIEGA